MTDAEIYLRAAERIDSGELDYIHEALWDSGCEEAHIARALKAFWKMFESTKDFDRETRVLALCFMAAMEKAK